MKAAANILKLVSDGLYKEALSLYNHLHASSFPPDGFTFPPLLKACGKLQSPAVAQQIHAHAIVHGLHARTHTATALTSAYMQLGFLEDALKMFDGIPDPGLPSFNAVISGFSQRGCFEELLRFFRQLQIYGLRSNSLTLASVLPACETLKQGSQLHGFCLKAGHGADDYVATALVTMYSNNSELDSARRVFELIHDKKVASYNAMISGFNRDASFTLALDLFREMIMSTQPNSSTMLSLLSMGSQNLVTWNTMISGFLRHGNVHDALDLFRQLRLQGFTPDAATWNAVICGFSKLGRVAEAFEFFTLMQTEQVAPPSLECTTSILQAFSSISDIHHGKEIHCHVLRTRAHYEDDVFLTTLIDMYMKCGYSVHSRKIFNSTEVKSKDPAIWNAMISGYGRNGENDAALEIFREMQEKRVKPNAATFLASLSACSHSGQVEKGIETFRMMTIENGISPSVEHLGCLIDLLARAGKLAEAWDIIREIPKPSVSMYSSLLGACGCYVEVELGKMINERLCELEPTCSAAPVILSNIYATQERWEEVEVLRKYMKDKKLHKKPSRTWIES